VSGLQLVERVMGRLTTARAASAGPLTGVWPGLLILILVGLFMSGHSFLAAAVTGAADGGGRNRGGLTSRPLQWAWAQRRRPGR
jgi:hypothetical protein